MMLMLTLDDAIKVTQRLVEDAMNDEDIIRQELEQKCWVPSDSEPAKQLYDLIFDINPAEICAQIESGNLKKWCETIQVVMNLAMVRLQSAQPEVTEEAVKEYCRKRCLCIVDSALLKKYASAQPEIIRCKDCIHFDSEDDCECPMDVRYSDFFCKMGERRTDEQT